MHHALKFSEVTHFADDTNLIQFGDNLRSLSEALNSDLNFLNEWLNANKIALNTGKTEYIVFKGRSKCLGDIDIVLGGQKLNRSQNPKYLGVLIDEHLKIGKPKSLLFALNFEGPTEPCRKFAIMSPQTFFSTFIMLYSART